MIENQNNLVKLEKKGHKLVNLAKLTALSMAISIGISSTALADKPDFLALKSNNIPITNQLIVNLKKNSNLLLNEKKISVKLSKDSKKTLKAAYKENRTAFNSQYKEIKNILKSYGVSPKEIRKMAKEGFYTINISGIDNYEDLRSAFNELESTELFESVELDSIVTADSFVPNDRLFSYQDTLSSTNGINASAMWSTRRGNPDVVIAVLDTGGQMWTDGPQGRMLPGYDFVSLPDDVDGVPGRDGDPSIPQGGDYHGVGVASVIFSGQNNSIGMAGIDNAAKYIPVRVLGGPLGTGFGPGSHGYTSDVVDAIIWAAGGSVYNVPKNNNPANIISMSLGGWGASCGSAYQNAINYARSKGVVVVAAAGNANKDASLHSPSNCNGVIAVGASDGNYKASFSNYSNSNPYLKGVDVYAPGVRHVIFDINSKSWMSGFNGTSFATPIVSGMISLLMGEYPSFRNNRNSQDEGLIKALQHGGSTVYGCPYGTCDELATNGGEIFDYVKGVPDTVPALNVYSVVATKTNGKKCYVPVVEWAPEENHMVEYYALSLSPTFFHQQAWYENWNFLKNMPAQSSFASVIEGATLLPFDAHIGISACNDNGCGPRKVFPRIISNTNSCNL